MRVHLIFYISLLELTDLSTLLQDTFHYKAKKKNKFEIEAILAQENQRYLIKWKKYLKIENIWEPKTNL